MFLFCSVVRDFLGDEVPVDSIKAIIDEADIDHDRQISYNEFLDMWNQDSEERLKFARQDVVRRRIISREPSFVSSISSDDDVANDDLIAELRAAEEIVSSEAFNSEVFPETSLKYDFDPQLETLQQEQQDAVWV